MKHWTLIDEIEEQLSVLHKSIESDKDNATYRALLGLLHLQKMLEAHIRGIRLLDVREVKE